jgi:Cu-processing system ATP-binding protein
MKEVQARGLEVSFGSVDALDDVSLTLREGKVIMLAGPNGAGKSTLMKVLLGLIRPDHASFEVDGRRVAIDNAWKQHIGYLPEAVGFSENLTGRQLLRFFARARAVEPGRESETLERVGLREASGRAIRGYSRGMRQRLGIAVAILSTPDLLILDEPTVGLDQEGLSVLWDVIDEWRDAGRMVLVSSHDLAMMERRVDEVCVLRRGRVIANGTSNDLRRAAMLPHRIWFEIADAGAARVDLLCDAMRKWGKGSIEREEGGILAEVAQESILELVEIQSGFPGVVAGIRVEEPTLDLVYDKLLNDELKSERRLGVV